MTSCKETHKKVARLFDITNALSRNKINSQRKHLTIEKRIYGAPGINFTIANITHIKSHSIEQETALCPKNKL